MAPVPLPQPIDILVARNRIGDAARRTPLQPSAALAEASGAAEVRLKLEHLQNTGSFKIRGAWNKVAAVAEFDPRARLVTASTGNHGIAVAHAAADHRMSVTILVGAGSSPAKLERLRALESDTCVVELFGRDSDDTEAEARRRDLAGQAIYIPPYNDPLVIAGQGTVGLEILEEWPELDTVVVPMGGGGLISGIGLWLKTINPRIRLVGVQPEASPPFAAQRVTGSAKPIPIGPTLADGVAGNVERGSITWKLTPAPRRRDRAGGRNRNCAGHGLGAADPSPPARGERCAGHRGHRRRAPRRPGRTAGGGDHQRRQRGRRDLPDSHETGGLNGSCQPPRRAQNERMTTIEPEPTTPPADEAPAAPAVSPAPAPTPAPVQKAKPEHTANSGLAVLGALLVVFGVVFLVQQLAGDAFGDQWWPFLILAPGVALLTVGLVIPTPE